MKHDVIKKNYYRMCAKFTTIDIFSKIFKQYRCNHGKVIADVNVKCIHHILKQILEVVYQFIF